MRKIVILSILSLFFLLLLAFTACQQQPELVPPSPTPTPAPAPAPAPTPVPSPPPPEDESSQEYVEIYYDDLLVVVNSFVDDISMYIKTNQSDKEAMSMFRNKLKERNIETGLVSINSKLEGRGNLDYCIAVKTIDRDIVYLTVIPSDQELADESERLQFVYLKQGERVGIIPAKFSVSNSYDWYQTYLEETYDYFSYTEYLEEYNNIIDKNESRLDEIDNINQKIIRYIEDPPMLLLEYLSDSEYDRINRELDKLIDLANSRLDKYNEVYLTQFNDQIADFNNELSIANELSDRYPMEIFYIEEYFINPNLYPQLQLPLFTPIPLPEYPLLTPEVIYTDVDSYLSALSDMINSDDSYNQISKPDKSQFSIERITDKNFVVTSFKIRW